MNLDTAAAFMTPIMLYAARGLGADETPFLYGAVLMANAASLFLPGSNLTNLLVGAHLGHLLPGALIATAVTGLFLLVRMRGQSLHSHARDSGDSPFFRIGPGCAGAVVAAVLVVALPDPALPVLGSGLLVAVVGLDRRAAVRAVGPKVLAALFVVAVAVGTFARAIDLTLTAGRWATAAIGAGASITINNLPSASLLSANPPAHPEALLIGLNLGPNLAVTGSLSALIWWRAAKRLDARPSVLRYSLVGAPPAVLAIVLATLSLPG